MCKEQIFNESTIDRLFEYNIINVEEMWKLREAYDLWSEVIQRKGEQNG